eukprot:12372289-Alexandrium_andersonii.AAC.1
MPFVLEVVLPTADGLVRDAPQRGGCTMKPHRHGHPVRRGGDRGRGGWKGRAGSGSPPDVSTGGA